MPPLFCIVSLGRFKGKTTLLEWLVRQLSRSGIRIATIKHSTKPLDLEEKDTWRHLEAGSLEVAYVSPNELITIRRSTAFLKDAVEALHVDPDLILAEGFKLSSHPKILCAADLHEVDEALKSIQNIVAITGKIAEEGHSFSQIKVMKEAEVLEFVRKAVIDYWLNKIPGLNCGKCSYGSCSSLAKAIKEGKATIRECVMHGVSITRLRIGGEEVPLGKWPQSLLRELLKAFVKSLKLKDLKLDAVGKMIVEIDLRAFAEEE